METHDTRTGSQETKSGARYGKPPYLCQADRSITSLFERHLSWEERIGPDAALLPEADKEAIAYCTFLLCEHGNKMKGLARFREGGYSFRGLRQWQVPISIRFWSKVDIVQDAFSCWNWKASLVTAGYGCFDAKPAHRYIAENIMQVCSTHKMVIDHVCRNRRCVRPSHLRYVTQRENTLNGVCPTAFKMMQTHCIHGHPLSGSNLYLTPSGKRHCRVCIARRNQEFRLRRKQRG